MRTERRFQFAKAALVVALVGLLVSVVIVISSLAAGVGTTDGMRLSQIGTSLLIGFLVLVLVLAGLILRWRQQAKQH